MKKYLLIIAFCLSLFFVCGEHTFAKNETALERFNAGRDDAATEMGYVPDAQKPLAETVGTVIKMVLSLLGIVFLILMIYGGVKWMKSSGREVDVVAAKKIIENAIIGIILVFGAYALTAFISSSLAKVATGT